jgi:hypothetical protein
MSLDSSFREKAKSLAGIRASPDTKDLYFQDWRLYALPGIRFQASLIPRFSIDGA